jgi:hypothetical protein
MNSGSIQHEKMPKAGIPNLRPQASEETGMDLEEARADRMVTGKSGEVIINWLF